MLFLAILPLYKVMRAVFQDRREERQRYGLDGKTSRMEETVVSTIFRGRGGRNSRLVDRNASITQQQLTFA